MKNKILFIGDASSIHIKRWVDYFISKYDISLVTFSHKNITNCKRVFFLSNKKANITGGNYYYLFYINSIANILKTIKPNFIVSHYSYSMGLIGLLAKKIAKSNAVYGVVCHGSDILDLPKPKFLYKKLNQFVLRNSDKIFAVSDQIYDEILKMGINTDKVFVGQYGLKVGKVNFNNNRDIDILSNRNYVKNSNWEFILKNTSHLKNKKIIFIMPGLGRNISELRKKYPHISFYDSIPHEEIINLLKRTKIYISATKSDGTSLSLLEAMSYGAIPLVSNIVANRSWIVDGVNGYLFRNSIELKNKIDFILNMEESNLEKIRETNYRLISEKANYDKQMLKIEKFLME